MKGYKVTDKSRGKLVGVACDSLLELLTKGRKKLGIDEEVTAGLDDGTIVDDEDYFRELPAQTIFILYRKSEEMVTGVDVILNVLRRVNQSYLETGLKAKEFVLAKTSEVIRALEESGEGEPGGRGLRRTPQEDPEWFEGLDTNARTKEEFMFRKSQDRIRGYFYKLREDLRKREEFRGSREFRGLTLECLEFLRSRLKEDEYFGCYFDRRCARRGAGAPERKRRRKGGEVSPPPLGYEKRSFCDDAGKFACQGRWKASECEFGSEHRINPYLSREARILFSTWNLDHRIEKSRSVAPALAEAIGGCGKRRSVNFMYFYLLLFTRANLKLVHVVCHDKSVHDVSCDPRFVYK